MILTKKKAIKIAIELWEKLADGTITRKENWEGWDNYGIMVNCCSFCEYGKRKGDTYCDYCDYCPYDAVYGSCLQTGSPYDLWEEAIRAGKLGSAKRHAADFLTRLRTLL